MKLNSRNFFLKVIFGIVVIYLLVLAFLFIFQRSLMYHPEENNYSGDKLEHEEFDDFMGSTLYRSNNLSEFCR